MFTNSFILTHFFRLFKEQHDPKSIAEMKEEILYKYDENFDGKLELEEVFMTLFYKFSILFYELSRT